MDGVIVATCRHNAKRYCKNWDGKGEPKGLGLSDIGDIFAGQCPANKKACQFLVTPKPSPVLRAK